MLLSYLKKITKARKIKEIKKQIKIDTPSEIRKAIGQMERCSRCHFIVFDNYFKNEEEPSIIICPTCGLELLKSLSEGKINLPSIQK